MTITALRQQAAALQQHLAFLEADDRAYTRGYGPEIERTRRELLETRVKINGKRFQ